MDFFRKISREVKADVVVIGGGTAGVFAAISAAKTGAKTILIEKNAILGGTMTVAGVNFPGLFFAWGKQIISGPCWESIERTIKLDGAKMPEITFKPIRHWYEQIRLNQFVYTTVLFQMCEEAGVEVMCNCMISAVMKSDDTLKIIITDKSGLFVITANAAVDATGDANFVQMAGYAVEKSAQLQPATLQNHISGYDFEHVDVNEITEKLEQATLPSHITADKLISFIQNHKIDMHIPCFSADTSCGKTKLDQNAFIQTLKVYEFLKEMKGLENIVIDFAASETGVRETNRIIGETTVTAEDYVKGVFYPDSICYSFYPIDRHVMNGIEQVFINENIVPKIPYSALIPKNSRRILCAGRCIASDPYSNSAIRVEATCMATGQAAGCAAALSARRNENVRSIPYDELCNALKAINAIVPTNCPEI